MSMEMLLDSTDSKTEILCHLFKIRTTKKKSAIQLLLPETLAQDIFSTLVELDSGVIILKQMFSKKMS